MIKRLCISIKVVWNISNNHNKCLFFSLFESVELFMHMQHNNQWSRKGQGVLYTAQQVSAPLSSFFIYPLEKINYQVPGRCSFFYRYNSCTVCWEPVHCCCNFNISDFVINKESINQFKGNHFILTCCFSAVVGKKNCFFSIFLRNEALT